MHKVVADSANLPTRPGDNASEILRKASIDGITQRAFWASEAVS
jgi:hypothetical protein